MEAHVSRPDRQPRRSVALLLNDLAQTVQALPGDRQELLRIALTMPTADSLSESLRDAIRESGMTHFALGKLAGVATSQIDRFVRGERDLRLETAGKLASVLGLKLGRVAGKSRRPKSGPPSR